jgi:20S proteasome alpha/beta subunit
LPGYAGDEADIEFLLRKIKPASLEAVETTFERFFPGDALSERARNIVERVLKEEAK